MTDVSPNIIFFGSTADSILVADMLLPLNVGVVVTQQPRPVGRKQLLTPTPVEDWAHAQRISVQSFPSDPEKPWLYEDETRVIDALVPFQADLLISASYGQKIPWEIIRRARYGGLNIHPSLLPRWRGADPVPWAILSGDRKTGVTVVTLSEDFDAGTIIAQKTIPILDTDTSRPLRTKLFTLGADLLVETLPTYLSAKRFSPSLKSPISPSPYARRLTRQDGFESWEAIEKALENEIEARRIDRKFRAFTPWPGLWTLLRQGYGGEAKELRLKILALHLDSRLILDTVQLEGKKPVSWQQFARSYRFPT